MCKYCSPAPYFKDCEQFNWCILVSVCFQELMCSLKPIRIVFAARVRFSGPSTSISPHPLPLLLFHQASSCPRRLNSASITALKIMKINKYNLYAQNNSSFQLSQTVQLKPGHQFSSETVLSAALFRDDLADPLLILQSVDFLHTFLDRVVWKRRKNELHC